jgi:hypothetical protein
MKTRTLPWGRPRRALKLGPTHAAWVDLSKHWWGGARRHLRQIDLPPDLLRPSPVERNIGDPDALAAQLRALIGTDRRPAWSPCPIVLVLPDLCVRASLMELATLPADQSERDALIRWRLDKEAFFPMAGARLVSQVIGPNTVLAVVIRDAVLLQYEQLCERLGLAPVEVDVSSFRLCNLFVSLIPPLDTAAWLSLLDGGFSLVIFHHGRPAFIRTKIHSPGRPEGVIQDLKSSFAFFTEKQAQAEVRRLILFSEEPQADLSRMANTELGLEVLHADWSRVPPKRRLAMADRSKAPILAAAAGVYGA